MASAMKMWMSGKTPAATQPGEVKKSWASLSSSAATTAANTAANSWGESLDAPTEAGQGTFNVPPGLAQLPEDGPAMPIERRVTETEDDMAAENARLVLENEMLRMQCMQASQCAAAAAQAAAMSSYMGGMQNMAMPPGQFQTPWTHRPRKSSGRNSLKSEDGRKRVSSGSVKGQQASAAAEGKAEDVVKKETLPDRPKTTVMLRNLPNNHSRTMLLNLLDSEGFAGQYDFIYLPIDFKSNASLGYAFINLVTPEQAERFFPAFEGFNRWAMPSQKTCAVSWSDPYQGLEEHIERFRNSPVMHESVPEANKPILLQDGVESPFPEPTKRIKAPRVRPGRGQATGDAAAAP